MAFTYFLAGSDFYQHSANSLGTDQDRQNVVPGLVPKRLCLRDPERFFE